MAVAETLGVTINPQEQQIHDCQYGTGDDQLLRQEAGERDITGKCAHHDGHDRRPDREPQHLQPLRGRDPVPVLSSKGGEQNGYDDARQHKA
jgi:hypothetical protein